MRRSPFCSNCAYKSSFGSSSRRGTANGSFCRFGLADDRPEDDVDIHGEIPPRRFTASQLVKLSKISTAIDCECPSQLAALVNELSAFEVYSANCANRNEEDERLHRYLHRTTAEARAVIERALQRVVEIEKIVV